MADMLKNALKWLNVQMQEQDGTNVMYHRGASSVGITAVVQKPQFVVDGETVVLVDWEGRDFMFNTISLVLGGVLCLPQRGDQIVETVGGATYTFDVMAPTAQTPVWEWSDKYRDRLRVHCKLVPNP